MAIPSQVQAALDAANATLAGAQPAPPEGAFAVAETAPEPVQVAPQPEAAPVPNTPPKDEPWEQRYRVLQGKYSSEVPELHKRVHGLEANLQSAVERLNAASEAKERAPEQSSAADPKDAENFGEDLVVMVQRVAQGAVQKAAQAFEVKASALEQKINQLAEQLTGTHRQVEQTAELSFFEQVTKLVPNWETVNADPAFLAWLADADPVYGVPRQAALDQAQKQMSAGRVAAVFNAFTGGQPPVPTKKPNPLANQVSPKSSAPAAPAATTPQTFTSAQVTSFYDDLNKGRYRGNDAEAQRIEQMINAALAEGRIR